MKVIIKSANLQNDEIIFESASNSDRIFTCISITFPDSSILHSQRIPYFKQATDLSEKLCSFAEKNKPFRLVVIFSLFFRERRVVTIYLFNNYNYNYEVLVFLNFFYILNYTFWVLLMVVHHKISHG